LTDTARPQVKFPSTKELLDFLGTLRVHGIHLAAAEIYRVERILSTLEATLAPQAALSTLPFALTAVLAKSPDQQASLHASLIRWTNENFGQDRETTKQRKPDLSTEQGVSKRPIKIPWRLIVVGLLTILVVVGALLHQFSPRPKRSDFPPTVTPRTENPEIKIAITAEQIFIGIVALSLLWILATETRRRRALVATRAKGLVRDILDTGAAPFGQWLYESTDVKRLGFQLQDLRAGAIDVVDETRTIENTIKRGGLFSPVFQAVRRQPVYGVLLQEESRHDHLARLGENLAQSLRNEGVQLELSYCTGSLFDSGDPNRSYNRRAMVSLKNLPESRLLVIGDGKALMSPSWEQPDVVVSRETSAWGARLLLSTQPIETWGEREIALMDDGWNIATARISGLAAVVRHLPDIVNGGQLLEGRRASPQSPRNNERLAVVEILSAQIRDLKDLAASDQVADELGGILKILADDPFSGARRLLALGTRGLVTLTSGSMESIASLASGETRPRDSAEILDELHAKYRALKGFKSASANELLGAVLAYRTMLKLKRYQLNPVALSVFDPRLADRGLRSTVADFALAVVTGALASGRTADLLEGSLGIPEVELREHDPDVAVQLSDDAAFVGRTALREFARHLPHQVSSRVLFCLGGPGSGKSASGEYLALTAHRTEAFNFISLGTHGTQLMETEERLRKASSMLGDEARFVSTLLSVEATQAGWMRDRVTLLFVDDLELLSRQGRATLGQSVSAACTYSSRLRICATGPTDTLPDRLLVAESIDRFVSVEYLSVGFGALDPESAIADAWLARMQLGPA
jgi:hypothetical protein